MIGDRVAWSVKQEVLVLVYCVAIRKAVTLKLLTEFVFNFFSTLAGVLFTISY